jgi:hypothetical protein
MKSLGTVVAAPPKVFLSARLSDKGREPAQRLTSVRSTIAHSRSPHFARARGEVGQRTNNNRGGEGGERWRALPRAVASPPRSRSLPFEPSDCPSDIKLVQSLHRVSGQALPPSGWRALSRVPPTTH